MVSDFQRGIMFIITFAVLIFSAGLIAGLLICPSHQAEDAEAVVAVAVLHDQEQHIADYLEAQGAVNPSIFAAACMETSNPELCAAVALIESNCRVYCPRGAAGEIGPWQIIPVNWSWMVGKPSNDPFTAARQWDLIHAHLLDASPSLPFAISAYNGGGKGYVFSVWKHFQGMKKITP